MSGASDGYCDGISRGRRDSGDGAADGYRDGASDGYRDEPMSGSKGSADDAAPSPPLNARSLGVAMGKGGRPNCSNLFSSSCKASFASRLLLALSSFVCSRKSKGSMDE
jgi:hypothetical protein